MADNNHNNGQLQLELSPDVAQGEYSNLAMIIHSHSEFILDFAAMLPGLQKAARVWENRDSQPNSSYSNTLWNAKR